MLYQRVCDYSLVRLSPVFSLLSEITVENFSFFFFRLLMNIHHHPWYHVIPFFPPTLCHSSYIVVPSVVVGS